MTPALWAVAVLAVVAAGYIAWEVVTAVRAMRRPANPIAIDDATRAHLKRLVMDRDRRVP